MANHLLVVGLLPSYDRRRSSRRRALKKRLEFFQQRRTVALGRLHSMVLSGKLLLVCEPRSNATLKVSCSVDQGLALLEGFLRSTHTFIHEVNANTADGCFLGVLDRVRSILKDLTNSSDDFWMVAPQGQRSHDGFAGLCKQNFQHIIHITEILKHE